MNMRGNDEQQGVVFSYITPEQRVPQDHPLRRIRQMADTALQQLSGHFETLYARRGRPSIPPERLIRALLLQILYSLRSEALLMEQVNFNILYRDSKLVRDDLRERCFMSLPVRVRAGIHDDFAEWINAHQRAFDQCHTRTE